MIIASKVKLTTDIRKFLVFVVLNVGLPTIILNSFFQVDVNRYLFKEIITVFFTAIIFYTVSILILFILVKAFGFSNEKQREISFLSNLGNTGFIGIPLCGVIFGPKGTLFAAAFDVATCIFIYTIGSMILQNNMKITLENLRKVITLPFISVMIGIFIILMDVKVHFFIKDFVQITGSIATPLALIYVGMLSFTFLLQKSPVELKPLIFSVTYKLMIFPTLGVTFLFFIPMSIQLKSIFLVEISMPTIATASVFFTQFGNDENYAVVHTLVTSFLCIITIPIVVYFGLFALYK